MRQIINRLSRRSVNGVFGGYFLLILLMALAPPAYLWSSGNQTLVLGLPTAAVYWIIIALLLGLGVWALYAVERLRGELPDDDAESAAEPVPVPQAHTGHES